MPTDASDDLQALLTQIENTPDYQALKQAGQRPEELLSLLATYLEPDPGPAQAGMPCKAANAALVSAALALRHIAVHDAYRVLTWNPTPEIRTTPAEQNEFNDHCSRVIHLLSSAANDPDTRREIRHLADYFNRLSGGEPIEGLASTVSDLVLGVLEAVKSKTAEIAERALRPECLYFEVLDCELRAGQAALKVLQNSLIERPAGPMEFYFQMEGRIGDKLLMLWRTGVVPRMECLAPSGNTERPRLSFPPIKTDAQGRMLGKNGKPLPGLWYDNDDNLLANLDALQPPAAAHWRLYREMDADMDRCELPGASEYFKSEARSLANTCSVLQRMINDKARRDREAHQTMSRPRSREELRANFSGYNEEQLERLFADWRVEITSHNPLEDVTWTALAAEFRRLAKERGQDYRVMDFLGRMVIGAWRKGLFSDDAGWVAEVQPLEQGLYSWVAHDTCGYLWDNQLRYPQRPFLSPGANSATWASEMLALLCEARAQEVVARTSQVTARRSGGPDVAWQPVTEIEEQVKKLAQTARSILLLGETGTGKEYLARRIHNNSQRKTGPFVAVNCPALPKDRIDAELYGYARGAFTGADKPYLGKIREAAGGTVFLDEIGDLPPECWGNLLRFLQSREISPLRDKAEPVDVRVLAATNKLERVPREALHRFDHQLCLPPLRERRRDILEMADGFFESAKSENNHTSLRFAKAEIDKLASADYDWPGNIRQLEKAIQRAVLLHAPGRDLTAQEILEAAKTVPD